jgi:hypothetical protein
MGPQHPLLGVSKPAARAMPPLTGVTERYRAESDRGSALMSATASRSLSLFESSHPGQGSGLAASLAPRSWHEQRSCTSNEPQALRDA